MTLDAARARAAELPLAVQLLCLTALGAIAALGQPPIGAWYATLLAFAGLFFWFPMVRSARQAGLALWLFGTAYFIVALRWLVEPFQVEAELFGWMAPFALVGMSGGLALFWAAAAWVARRLPVHASQPGIALVITLSLAELGRAYLLTGFPWAGISQIWSDTHVLLGLSAFGPHGLSVLTLLLAVAAFEDKLPLWRRALGAFGLVLGLHVPYLSAPVTFPGPGPDAPTIRIVQPNAPQHQKWDPAFAGTFFWRQIEATRAEGAPDLIVWPETAIPQLFNNAEETLKVVADAAAGVPVVLGMQRAESRDYYNSLLVLEDTGEVRQIYDKHHLVPFGEYMPMQLLFGLLGIEAIAQRFDTGYTAGPGPQLLDFGPVGTALPLICYEAIFPQHARSPTERPAFLLQLTNDAWFGNYAGPQQHLAQARMRAIEQGLPMVRSANTGISAMIDSYGRITAALPLGEPGFVDAQLPKARSTTLYALTGDWPVMFLVLAGLIWAAVHTRRTITD